MGVLDVIRSGEVSDYYLDIRFEVRSQEGLVGSKIDVVGNVEGLGYWRLQEALQLKAAQQEDGSVIWGSVPVSVPITKFPIHYKYVANGHRVSPTTRPLIWDLQERVVLAPPRDGVIHDTFEPTAENSDTGWVTGSGMGALQLRVGQPPGSKEPLVVLPPELQQQEPFDVHLFEARPGDPNVPQGKAFAVLQLHDLGYIEEGDGQKCEMNGNVGATGTYLMNGQTLDALAFRVDVVAGGGGELLSRCFVSAASLATLEGHISASLMTPQLQFGGTFRAAFLVVTAADFVGNDLSNVQRVRWTPATSPNSTLDIGHRGSGATKVRDHHVRENTILSFLKAATNHSDFIEFDVHVTGDGEVIVHHDFDVKLSVGNETVKLGISQVTSKQLQSSEFTSHMSVSSPTQLQDIERLGAHKQQQRRTFKRHMSSGEDMLRQGLHNMASSPPNGGPSAGGDGAPVTPQQHGGDYSSWRLPDRIATLREALRRTPLWLGFNIELKYPTDAELQGMASRFYSRNYFVDAVLKVLMEEGANRKIIFSSFDPDVATLCRLKQPRYPVFFLTCAGTKAYSDPRMASLEAALAFAKCSQLQGVVVESSGMAHCLEEVVRDCHDHGLFIFSWGDANNDLNIYNRQKAAGVDAVIMDDVVKITKASGKKCSFFNKPLKSPASFGEVEALEALTGGLAPLAIASPPSSSAHLAHV
mmetsp:Transcript_6370/g.18321  ORF Transcript_6370/g.18321 Transcript_6370/m.18321 type:complete len:699 (+) Transcript_6370:300-2396(+)|eukprot:CAMPEP_0206143712 /NCGR_PEP_ID=MMETSP1473-20131121/21536_1 /ASSEMBLY_ACC=CAM_ASM_001109 /TAXON_ID=1461547 /ORGANISM="Stichococcus sp, Strain RCC1054" /LENGTH=698 /DNA_ID=CAMNT_0053539235 /DNA_START=200 /DNA_END=2296 /DNA_ORIENTATION=+